MIGLSLGEAARLCEGGVQGRDVHFSGVGSDSRCVARGSLFAALCGPRFDGHEFVAAAESRGAAAALVSRDCGGGLPRLRVADTRIALGALAAGWRARHDLPVVGITGSNGKTTVKEMVAAVLAGAGPVLATRGNLNNDIGLPLTLLGLGREHRHAVVEMGANHAGEIAALCRIARPRVGVVTLCAPAHLEGFGSIEGVARAKGEMFAGLDEDGVAVINADDHYAPLWRDLAGPRRKLAFGFAGDADVRGRCAPAGDGIELSAHTPVGSIELKLRLLGRHNAANALAAIAVAVALDAPLEAIREGLEGVAPVPGRLNGRRAACGARVIDDTYNANPHSLAAALAVLADCPAPRALALGDMAELGEEAARYHAEAGEAARAAGVERLFAAGPLGRDAVDAFGAGASHHEDTDSLAAALGAWLPAEATVLVKGSRSARMERVVEALLADGETG